MSLFLNVDVYPKVNTQQKYSDNGWTIWDLATVIRFNFSLSSIITCTNCNKRTNILSLSILCIDSNSITGMKYSAAALHYIMFNFDAVKIADGRWICTCLVQLLQHPSCSMTCTLSRESIHFYLAKSSHRIGFFRSQLFVCSWIA